VDAGRTVEALRGVRHVGDAEVHRDEEEDEGRCGPGRGRRVGEQHLRERERGVERVQADVLPYCATTRRSAVLVSLRNRKAGRTVVDRGKGRGRGEERPEDGGDDDGERRDGREQQDVERAEEARPALERVALL
jgi:hypothetical protein